jgi:hypothetical protein
VYSDVAQRFLMVGGGGASPAATSPDGITWTDAGTTPSAPEYGPGPAGFLAVSAVDSKISTSPDGVTWETEVALGNWQPAYVSQNGVITGPPRVGIPGGFCSGVSAERRPRLLATHLGVWFYKVIRTQIAWVAGSSGGEIYVSQPLAF